MMVDITWINLYWNLLSTSPVEKYFIWRAGSCSPPTKSLDINSTRKLETIQMWWRDGQTNIIYKNKTDLNICYWMVHIIYHIIRVSVSQILTLTGSVLSVSVSVRGRGGPKAQSCEGGGGERRVAVSHLPPRGLLDVHPQPVDLPAGRGEVALQLQLPLSQSETPEIVYIKYLKRNIKYQICI